MKTNASIIHLAGSLLMLAFAATFPSGALAQEQEGAANRIEKVDFAALPGGRVAIRVQTTEPLANPPAGFTLNNPPRIALDFPNTASALSRNTLSAGQGALKSVNVAQAKSRTRLVLNLSRAVGYSATVSGNETLTPEKPSY